MFLMRFNRRVYFMARIKAVPFKKWIDEITVNELASLMRVDRATVRHWRTGWVLPRDDQKLKIYVLSRGAVGLQKMIEDHYSEENKKRRPNVRG
jgi:hypothetical protein